MDPITLLLDFGLIGGGILTLREIRMWRSTSMRVNAVKQKQQYREASFSDMLSNLDMAIGELQKIRDQQEHGGATLDQLKPIDTQLSRMKWVSTNRWWIEPVLPYVEKSAKSVMKVVSQF